jgi:hypothetical protein
MVEIFLKENSLEQRASTSGNKDRWMMSINKLVYHSQGFVLYLGNQKKPSTHPD